MTTHKHRAATLYVIPFGAAAKTEGGSDASAFPNGIFPMIPFPAAARATAQGALPSAAAGEMMVMIDALRAIAAMRSALVRFSPARNVSNLVARWREVVAGSGGGKWWRWR